MSNHFQPGPGDLSSGFNAGFLQTGSLALDELLRTCDVPKGGTVYLDFQSGQWPMTFLLSLCKTALSRGERAVFLYAPTFSHMMEDDEEGTADLRSGRALEFEFEEALRSFELSPFFNRQNPADPKAKLRYLVANTFPEFEDTFDSLMSEGAGAPDLVVVYGLDQLFQNVRLFRWMPEEGDALYLVREESERLRRFLREQQGRLAAAGTSLYLSRSADSYALSTATLFTRGLGPLLYAQSAHTLFVEKTVTECGCGQCPWDMPGVVGVPVTLYRRDELLGETVISVLEGEDGPKAFNGPFLDGEPGVADFLDALS